ncbi:hypothetical protein RRF57_000535 [Xylaria bambusicola]|uniref:Uncharacterized protein n=1 Tax=Xylaria bambusicola TaxID=326684 RepID=A0AAN7U9Z1_9PEZI
METTYSSIGVELEFLLCIAESDSLMKTPRRFRDSGAPLILPAGVRRYENIISHIISRVQRTINNALLGLRKPGDRVVQSDAQALADPEALHLRPYLRWNIGTDPSFSLPQAIKDKEQYIDEYRWYPTEISSPALWATEASWEEIGAVVKAVKNEFWVITPPDAGTHYHYGYGKDYIPCGKLRRIAALLFAADPIMVQLHPKYRRNRESCLSNRLYSRGAHGRSAAALSREIGAGNIEVEPEDSARSTIPSSFLMSFPRPVRERGHGLMIPFKRGELTGYTFSEALFGSSGYLQDNADDVRPADIPSVVHELLQCPNAPTVAELMRFSSDAEDRPAYSFRAYTLGIYKHVIRSNGEINVNFQNKRTIEFRQMASTMISDEVVAHGKIIVKLCEFAAEAALSDFWKVVLDCTVAELTGNWFDVFDLFAELALVSEARILQHAVARSRAETTSE